MVINLFKIHFEIIFLESTNNGNSDSVWILYIFPGPTPRTRIHVPDINRCLFIPGTLSNVVGA